MSSNFRQMFMIMYLYNMIFGKQNIFWNTMFRRVSSTLFMPPFRNHASNTIYAFLFSSKLRIRFNILFFELISFRAAAKKLLFLCVCTKIGGKYKLLYLEKYFNLPFLFRVFYFPCRGGVLAQFTDIFLELA